MPLIPANSDLRYLLYEITENQSRWMEALIPSARSFLIKKNKYVELITAQDVFELTAKGCDPDDSTLDSLHRTRIPFRSPSTTIRDAFFYMIAKVGL